MQAPTQDASVASSVAWIVGTVDELPPIRTLYQPIVRLSDGRLFGYEALSRGPAGTPMEPARALFAWAHQAGRLREVEMACLRLAITGWVRAIRTRLHSQAPGRQAPELVLFLNVHPLSLAKPSLLPELLRWWIDESDLPARSLVLELTEAISLDALGSPEQMLQPYRRQGLRIGVDDLGAGHSALSSLFTLRPEFVKLDRSLVQECDRDRVRQHMLRGIVEAAHAAAIAVIAEGIERPEELEFLARIGVHMGQGFFLGHPRPDLEPPNAEALRLVTGLRSWNVTVHGLQPEVGVLVEPIAPVSPEAPVTEVLTRFEHDPDLAAVAVVDRTQPVGLVMRERLFYMLGQRYGRAIFERRPVKLVADASPLVVDEHTALSDVARLVTGRTGPTAYDAVIVTSGGQYRGLVSVRRLLELMTHLQLEAARDANPLTGLPGNRVIEYEISRRLARGEDFSVLYCDIDDFKAFNDHYDFKRGDQAIRTLAEILQEQAARFGRGEAFVGHVGGDDFVVVLPGREGEKFAHAVVHAFKSRVRALYDPADLQRGYIEGRDRRGNLARFGLMSLSIAILHNPQGRIVSYLEFASNVGQLKRQAKIQPGDAVVSLRVECEPRAQGLRGVGLQGVGGGMVT